MSNNPDWNKPLLDPFKPKKNTARKMRTPVAKRVKLVINAAPEVMVKITKFNKASNSGKAGKGTSILGHLEYISRNGKLEVETDKGELLNGMGEVKELYQDWMTDINADKKFSRRRDTMQMVLSMPSDTEPEAVRKAVREFAKETFAENYEYVFALHTDTPNPHCHITVKCLGKDGKRLNPRKDDLQLWREVFAEKMVEQGYEAEATPRPVRGVVKKPAKQVVLHIAKGDKTHKPRIPKILAEQVKEAAQEIEQEQAGWVKEEPEWKKKLIDTHNRVRDNWRNLEKELRSTDESMANKVKDFIEKMPRVETKREQIKTELKKQFGRKQDVEKVVDTLVERQQDHER